MENRSDFYYPVVVEGKSIGHEGATPTILLSYTVFVPCVFVKFALLQQLYCFRHNRAVEITPYGKRHISRTKPVKPLQSTLEEGLH